MGIFAIAEDDLAELKSLRAYAEEPAHYYRPERGDGPPGDKKEYRRMLHAVGAEDGKPHKFKVVFSITENKGKRFRQASLSLDGFKNKKYPHPDVSLLICQELGFIGEPTGWVVFADLFVPGAVVINQMLGDVV